MPKLGQGERREKIESLCQLIVDLDSVRAFKRVKPELLREGFERMKSAELMQMWKTIRHDVDKIAYMPLKIQGLPTLMRLAAFLKLLSPLVSIFMVLSLAALFRSPKGLPIPLPAIFAERTTFVITFILSFAIFIAFIIVDYIIRRKVVKYEEEHMDKFSRGRERIKNVIQELIAKLTEELKRQNEDPNNFKMILFHKYKGLKIIKETRGRIIKRKYPLYTAICSMEG